MSQDPRYKIYSPTWMRIEELGARGLTLSQIKDAYSYGLLTSYATHGIYLSKVQNLNFADKDAGDNPVESTYEYEPYLTYTVTLYWSIFNSVP